MKMTAATAPNQRDNIEEDAFQHSWAGERFGQGHFNSWALSEEGVHSPTEIQTRADR
jgi:hypothetical protein